MPPLTSESSLCFCGIWEQSTFRQKSQSCQATVELKVLILPRSVLRGTHTCNDHFRAGELRLTPPFSLRGHGTGKTLILIVTAKVTQHTANVLIKESKQVLSLKKEEPAGRAELYVNTNDKSSVSSSFRPSGGLTLLWSKCTKYTTGYSSFSAP